MENKILIFAEYLGNKVITPNGRKITLTASNLNKVSKGDYRLILKSIYDLSDKDKDFIFEYDRCRRSFFNLGVGTEYKTTQVSSESRNTRTAKDAMLSFEYRGKEHEFGNLHSDWCRIGSLLSVPYLKLKGYDMGSYWIDGKDLVKEGYAIYSEI